MVVLMRYVLGTLALLFVVLLSGTPRGLEGAQADAIPIEIAVERFTFTPSQIRVKAGSRLAIQLHSEDTAHGFHITGTDIDVEVPKRGRGTVTVSFVPAPGRYTFECSRVCGAGLEFMRGVIIASE